MRVLVTGGAGYIGSVTVARLLDAGHAVTVFDNLERGHIEALDPRVRFLRGDLRRSAEIERAMREAAPESVLHFAAYALVGESMREPGRYYENNVCGGFNLLRAAIAHGVGRLVFSSTCSIYGNAGIETIDEQCPPAPSNPYGHSKHVFEGMLHWFSRVHGLRWMALRYFNACGATATLGEDHEPETHLIPNVLGVALGHARSLTIFGDDYDTPDGTCVRDYIHVSDLADAHERALTSDAVGVVNLGVGRGFSVRDVVEAAVRVTGRAIPVEIGPRREGDPDRLVAAAGLAGRWLGWHPEFTDIDSMIASAWDWRRAHPAGYGGGGPPGRKEGTAVRTTDSPPEMRP